MFAVDIPDVPPQYAPVVIAQAGGAKQSAAKTDRILSVCQLIENPPMMPGGSAVNSMSPILALRNYFKVQEKRIVEGPSTATVLENPKHGELKDQGTSVLRHGTLVDTGERRYSYLAAPSYLGKDRSVLLVEMGGMRIKVVYSYHVVDVVEGNEDLCPSPRVRRIAFSP